jgi:Tol biopolymer transport system component
VPAHRRPQGIAVMTALLGALLMPSGALATYPAPTGLIAFSAAAGSGAQIWTIRPNGRDLRQVTHVQGDAVAPDWSPDGRLIVFETGRHLADDSDEVAVQVMHADGTGMTNLTSSLVCCSGDPSFTPDGQHIVYWRWDGVEEAVWMMNLDGSDQHRIIAVSGIADPNVSPDGQTLTLRLWDGLEGENGALFRSAIDGTGLTQLTPFDHVSIKHDWSPDGGLVLYTDGADTGEPDESTNIVTIRPDGTGLHHLTSYSGGHYGVFAGSYSPDGRWIVLRFEDHLAGTFALYRMRPDGSHLKEIAYLGELKPRLSDWGSRPEDDSDADQ